MKGRQASDRFPLKTAAGLMMQQRTGPRPSGAVPSLNKAATMAATPPAELEGDLIVPLGAGRVYGIWGRVDVDRRFQSRSAGLWIEAGHDQQARREGDLYKGVQSTPAKLRFTVEFTL